MCLCSDPNTYFAGAEDGTLHRCSCSYTEQSLEATPGHAGPIYRVRCSPKHPSAILTCGADWSVKLWHKGSCVQTFHPGDLTDAVHDVCWSPLSSTVFASVAGDGRVEVWDLANSKLDPAVSMFSNGTVNEDTYEDYDDPDFKGEILPAQVRDTQNCLSIDFSFSLLFCFFCSHSNILFIFIHSLSLFFFFFFFSLSLFAWERPPFCLHLFLKCC